MRDHAYFLPALSRSFRLSFADDEPLFYFTSCTSPHALYPISCVTRLTKKIIWLARHQQCIRSINWNICFNRLIIKRLGNLQPIFNYGIYSPTRYLYIIRVTLITVEVVMATSTHTTGSLNLSPLHTLFDREACNTYYSASIIDEPRPLICSVYDVMLCN